MGGATGLGVAAFSFPDMEVQGNSIVLVGEESFGNVMHHHTHMSYMLLPFTFLLTMYPI